MLTAGIHAAYERGVQTLSAQKDVQALARGLPSEGPHCGRAALFTVSGAEVLNNPEITREVFGASSVVVRCSHTSELSRLLRHLEGQLTATLHLESEDHALAATLVPILEDKAGRLLVNGWPTGVEVSHAMVHGGPFPATSDGRSTSVGTLAIDRFLRPVCYQNFPSELLPEVLREGAFERTPHRLDGAYR
jgi:NADP-dependent aldehyde dehydrogenase